jgi:hypothetical protein
VRKKENKIPKEILRNDVRETAIRSLQNAENAAVDSNCPGAIVDTDVIRIILEYVKELEESHAYVYDAYQDLGKEHFNFIESIKKKLEELKKEKEDYIKEYPAWDCDLDCIEDIRVMDAEIRILESILPEIMEEALEEMRGE